MSAIQVLLVAGELGLGGGIERDVSKYARHLSGHGISPHVACFRPGGHRWQEIENAGVPVLPLEVSSFKSRSAFHAAGELRSYIRLNRIQVVHSFDDASNFLGSIVARASRVPVVLTSQLCFRELSSTKNRVMLAFSDRLAKGVFVNCHAVAKDLSTKWRIPKDKIFVCHNGFEPEEFNPNDRGRIPELADASIVVGTVCMLREEKNIPCLVTAFSELAKIDSKARLLIVGSGVMKGQLERLVEDLSIRSSCLFLDSTSRPADYMQSIDIFVVPSRSEAFPNALLEAMACGCCPVASRVGGIPELIGQNERGVLFKSGDAQELAATLICLARDPKQRKTLASDAAAYAIENLSIDKATARLASIYRELLMRNSVSEFRG
jgi:glycosyltransferase involved in cell wall biosynthesis